MQLPMERRSTEGVCYLIPFPHYYPSTSCFCARFSRAGKKVLHRSDPLRMFHPIDRGALFLKMQIAEIPRGRPYEPDAISIAEGSRHLIARNVDPPLMVGFLLPG